MERAVDIHGEKYDYGEIDYKGYHKSVSILCKEHNIRFMQLPVTHLKYAAVGCLQCSNRVKSKEDFLLKAQLLHGTKFDYKLVEYTGTKNRINITCNICNKVFNRSPSRHLIKNVGCPHCTRHISKDETNWLDSLGLPNDAIHRQKWISFPKNSRCKGVRVDGFDPITNTIYLFHEDYWHGNPDKYKGYEMNEMTKTTFSFLHDRTKEIESILSSLGFHLVIKWEMDYKKELKTGDSSG